MMSSIEINDYLYLYVHIFFQNDDRITVEQFFTRIQEYLELMNDALRLG